MVICSPFASDFGICSRIRPPDGVPCLGAYLYEESPAASWTNTLLFACALADRRRSISLFLPFKIALPQIPFPQGIILWWLDNFPPFSFDFSTNTKPTVDEQHWRRPPAASLYDSCCAQHSVPFFFSPYSFPVPWQA